MLIYGGASAPSEEMIDSWLRQCLPEVREQRTGGHRRRFKASLVEPRRPGGSAFVAMSNRNRNSFLEVEGTLAMFEAVAQTRDYATTTRPAAATLRRLLDFNADVFGENIPGFGEATWLYELAASVSAAEDPLTAPLPSFSGTDGSGDQAVAMAKMGKWARESGLHNAAAATELLRRQRPASRCPGSPRGPNTLLRWHRCSRLDGVMRPAAGATAFDSAAGIWRAIAIDTMGDQANTGA